MKFDSLIAQVGLLPFFELPLLLQLNGAPKRQVLTQLHQWTVAGKLIHLRRGMYTLADRYRKAPLSVLQLANEMYRPSYLSGLWALSFYGLIPEKVATWTSVTPRVTRTFENSLGVFAYSSLKQTFFWGFSSSVIETSPVWMADPEKALLDYFHLTPGEWTEDRLSEMRFQNTSVLELNRLLAYTEQWGSPRLNRAIARFTHLINQEQEGRFFL